MAASITITGLSSTEPLGSSIIGPNTVVGKTVVGDKRTVMLQAGDNTVTVPSTQATAVLIETPTANTATITYRTSQNATDGGLPINSLAQPFFHVFPQPPPASLILNSSVGVSAPTTLLFI